MSLACFISSVYAKQSFTILKKRTDIIIKPADKGSGTVIMDHSWYAFTAMIILHFDLNPQFKYMNYFIYTSHHFTPDGRYELNKLTSLPMCSFIAQLVEHRTGIRGGHGFESR